VNVSSQQTIPGLAFRTSMILVDWEKLGADNRSIAKREWSDSFLMVWNLSLERRK
jgi:hypothetical protein